MFKKIIKNPYVIAGVIVFLSLLLLGVFALDFSWGESLFAAAALTVIGVGGIWWKQEVWP